MTVTANAVDRVAGRSAAAVMAVIPHFPVRNPIAAGVRLGMEQPDLGTFFDDMAAARINR